jgi:threonine dehydratase
MFLDHVPQIDDIKAAAKRINSLIHRTPVLTSQSINALVGANVYFKCENLQKAGAFKFRGATNAVLSLSDPEASRGVATHSSGNHAAALSLAAKMRGIPAHIVMPKNAPQIKVDAVKTYSGKITFCEPTQQAREQTLEKVVSQTGAMFVHPYNNYSIIAAQATAAKELLEQIPDLDVIITPVGGGGLLSGTALITHYMSPKTNVIAAEPAGADDAFRSLQTGTIQPSINPNTICDGLKTSLGDKTFSIIQKYVHSIITVEDEFIIQAMRLIWERMKIVVEPSAAVTLALLIKDRHKGTKAQRHKVGIILSGGNVDLGNLPWK